MGRIFSDADLEIMEVVCDEIAACEIVTIPLFDFCRFWANPNTYPECAIIRDFGPGAASNVPNTLAMIREDYDHYLAKDITVEFEPEILYSVPDAEYQEWHF